MHIAIDDTYGPVNGPQSKYITGGRKTHVAVAFPDSQVKKIREEISFALSMIREKHEILVNEFHFVDIYNRNGEWKKFLNGENLEIFEFFVSIYNKYKWKVHIQTIDNITLTDHPQIAKRGAFDGFDLSKREDLSLLLLLSKIKRNHPTGQLTLIIDEGRKRPGTQFSPLIFEGRTDAFSGSYQSSADEPLLQIADFLAFCINRSTYLSTKQKRTDTDLFFLGMVGKMQVNCPDIKRVEVDVEFTIEDIDTVHREGRRELKLEQ